MYTTLVASAARVATGNGSAFDTQHASSATFFLNVSASSGTTPTLDVVIQAKDRISGEYKEIVAFAQKTTTGTGIVVVGTGAVDDANTDAVAAIPLPRQLRAKWTIDGTSPSFTFSIGIDAKRE